LFFVVLATIGGYLGYVALDADAIAANQGQSLRTITVAESRGTIYDAQLRPLVNEIKEYRAALLPVDDLILRVRSATDAAGHRTLWEHQRQNTPTVVRLLRPVAVTEGIHLAHAPIRYSSKVLAVHLLGHLDGSGRHGASGIEAAFDAILTAYSGEATATFTVNGIGQVQRNSKIKGNSSLSDSIGGVALTIDLDVQQAVEEMAGSVEKGAVVVLDPYSGAIVASASFPTFHPEEVADSIADDNGALLNRALSLYDCGSVFKIVTASAALEAGISPQRTYTCAGGMTVGNTVFHCHTRVGHQELNMEQAFAKSCNLYFIQLVQEIGAESLLRTAEKLGLYSDIALANGIAADGGLFPSLDKLTVPAALANLSFGQGELLLSPLHIAAMTASIAANGVWTSPYLYKGEVDTSGTLHEEEGRGGRRVLSVNTSAQLQHMMELVVTEGTGKKAQPIETTAAGKTGTAQTGQLNNRNEVVQSWFTGYFPAKDPKYVITILVEDAENSGNNASEVFCEISNKLCQKEGKQTD